MRTTALILLYILLLTHTCFAQCKEELLQQALDTYNKKAYAASAALYRKAIDAGAGDANNYYNAACSYALSGDKEHAFVYLNNAVQNGYTDVDHLRKDTDLDTLHTDTRWQQLLAATTAKAERMKTWWNSKALETPYGAAMSAEEKAAGIARLWSEVKYNFANFDLVPALNWDSLYMAFLPRAIAAKSTADYYMILASMIAQLHDGHSNVYAPPALSNTLYARPAFRTRLVEDKVMVVTVWSDSLRRQGIREGLELLAINGMPVKAYAEKYVRPYQSASTSQDLDVRTYEYALFCGSADSLIHAEFADEKGKRFTCDIKRLRAGEGARNIPPYTLTWPDKHVALIALNSFESDQPAQAFLKDFDTLAQNASAIIFDVRNNGGGSGGVGFTILGCLTQQPFSISSWYTRDYRPAARAWGQTEERFGSGSNTWQADGKRYYDKPVYVLTSARTFSAAEDFVVAFDAMHRGRIIGEATGGSTGQPLFFSLPGGGSARVCTKRDTYPDGKEFVGKGVQPQIQVKPAVHDVQSGRDAVLEAALQEIRKTH